MINCINCNELIDVSEKDSTCPICGVLQNITETQVDYFSSYYKQSKKFGKLSEVATEDKPTSRAKLDSSELTRRIIDRLINIKDLLENSCKVLVNKYKVHYVVEEHVKYLCKLYINGVITRISTEDEENQLSNNNLNVLSDIKKNGVNVAVVILYIGLNKYNYKLNINNVYKIVYVTGIVKNKITKNLTPSKIYNFILSNNAGTSGNTSGSNTLTSSKDKDLEKNNLVDENNPQYYNKIILDRYNSLNNNSEIGLRLMCRTIIKHFELPCILYTVLDRLVDYYYYVKNNECLEDNKGLEEDESTICCALVLVLCRLLWPIFHFQPPSFSYQQNSGNNITSSSLISSSTSSTAGNSSGVNGTSASSSTHGNVKRKYKRKLNSIRLVTSPESHRTKMLELKKYIIDNYMKTNFNSFVISIIYKYINNYFLLFKLLPILNSNTSGNTSGSNTLTSSQDNLNKDSNDNRNDLYYSLLDIDFSPMDVHNSKTNNNFNKTDYSNSEIYRKIVNGYNDINFSGYSFEKSLEFNYFIFFSKKFKKSLIKNLSNIISFRNDGISDKNNSYNPVMTKLMSSYENKIENKSNDGKRRKTISDKRSSKTSVTGSSKDSNTVGDNTRTRTSRNTSGSNTQLPTNKVNLLEYESEKTKKVFQQFPSITRTGHTLPPKAFNLRNKSYHGLPVLYLLLLKSVSNLMGVPIYKVHGSVVNIESLLIGSITKN